MRIWYFFEEKLVFYSTLGVWKYHPYLVSRIQITNSAATLLQDLVFQDFTQPGGHLAHLPRQ